MQIVLRNFERSIENPYFKSSFPLQRSTLENEPCGQISSGIDPEEHLHG